MAASRDHPVDVASFWDIDVTTAERSPSGSNNLVWIFNGSFVLRIYQNLTSSRVEAEHRLLDALRSGSLPFHVPTPVLTPDGNTFVETPSGPAALYRFIPGRSATQDLVELELIGAALGDLMHALGEIPVDLAPVDWRRPLSGVHPAVPDVGELTEELRRLAPGAAGLDRLVATWRASDASNDALDLPVQVCHVDFAPGNVLIDDGVVVGVLDFEVAGLDLRINDVVAGLVQSTDTSAEREAFARGVRSRIELTQAEWAAVPELELRRKIATVLWRAGRWREGKSSLDDVLARLAVLDMEDEGLG